ncbi:hypothetical protein GQ600_27136 [Phytophthora cactorum]|nr:hypothetical protein GQ600_27136 [Phytophthora cactorum]
MELLQATSGQHSRRREGSVLSLHLHWTPILTGQRINGSLNVQHESFVSRKHTNKADRITILKGYDDSKVAMEVLLENQRLDKHGRGATEINSERRSKHCPYRLLNVVFSEEFFDKFITSGDTLTRAELDDGRRVFCDNVAEAFNTSNAVFDRLLSEDSLFEGIDPHQVAVYSAAKLKSMWKDCNSRFAAAEGRCKLSGSHAQFWNYCQGGKVAMYVHLWCEQRGSGRKFCASCVYKENEDVESNELQSASGTTERQTYRKRQKKMKLVGVAWILLLT